MVIAFAGHQPRLAADVYVAPDAVIVGQVRIGAGSSVWFNAVLRGDMDSITIGEQTNIQDLTMVHVDYGKPTTIGNRVVVGHRVIVHGCTIGDECIIGMGAVMLNRCRVGSRCIVAAGSVVREGFEVPDGTLVAGVPAVIKRPLKPGEFERIRSNADDYAARARAYRRLPA